MSALETFLYLLLLTFVHPLFASNPKKCWSFGITPARDILPSLLTYYGRWTRDIFIRIRQNANVLYFVGRDTCWPCFLPLWFLGKIFATWYTLLAQMHIFLFKSLTRYSFKLHFQEILRFWRQKKSDFIIQTLYSGCVMPSYPRTVFCTKKERLS